MRYILILMAMVFITFSLFEFCIKHPIPCTLFDNRLSLYAKNETKKSLGQKKYKELYLLNNFSRL